MFCHSCGKENKADSSFCKHCGVKLPHKDKSVHATHTFSSLGRVSRRAWIITVVVVLLLAGTAYAAPKIGSYIAVNAAVNNAEQLQAKGDYADALTSLSAVEGKWTFQKNKSELETLKSQEASFIQDQDNYNLAISDEASSTLGTSSLATAQQILQAIPNNYPQYSQVLSAISSVQSQIENQLQNQALQANDQEKAAQAEKIQADAQAAQAEAAAATAAKDKATAEAASAAAAQAQEEANAQAVAEAAAAAQSQAAEQQQVLLSFYNQLQSAYSSVNGDGISYYNSGNDYYEEGTELGDLDAISSFGQAEAIDKTADTDAINLNNFTNMPASYVAAGNNMADAANDCYQAASIAMEDAGNAANNDAYISPNLYSSECNSLMNSVHYFLSSTNPSSN